MAEIKWVKITTDMFDNRKIKQIRHLPEGNNIVLIWVMLLTIAGRCNASGMIFLTENIPYSMESLALELGFDQKVVQLALATLEKYGMIVCNEERFCISNWEEYQNVEGMEKIREQTRQRVANFRERKKALMESNVCQYCGDVATGYDHIIPKARGGKDVESNRVPCCIRCNRIKNDKPLVDFLNHNRDIVNDDIIAHNEKLSQYVTLSNVTGRYVVTQGNATEEEIEEDKDIKNKNKKIYEEFAAGNSALLDALKEFDSFRKKVKKPLTDKAKERLVSRLKTFPEQDWIEILHKSIDKGWTDVYQLDEKKPNKPIPERRFVPTEL